MKKAEGQTRPTILYLEDHRDNVVPDVSLAGKLLPVVWCERQHGGNVEHDFVALVFSVQAVQTRRIV